MKTRFSCDYAKFLHEYSCRIWPTVYKYTDILHFEENCQDVLYNTVIMRKIKYKLHTGLFVIRKQIVGQFVQIVLLGDKVKGIKENFWIEKIVENWGN